MSRAQKIRFAGPSPVFHERRLPERATPAGYAALIDAYRLPVPLPRTLSAIGKKHKIIHQDGWHIYSPRYAPTPCLEDHLTFALKYEGLDLCVLKKLFVAVGPHAIEKLVCDKPTGSYARRIWFLYEWLLDERLGLNDAKPGSYVDIVNGEQQFSIKGTTVRRQRVRNNLPGTRTFCPLVFRTAALEEFIAQDLPQKAREIVALVPRDLLARTAAFLLLKDSRSSFAIEGETPSQTRVQRWGTAIGEAGSNSLDLDELLRLQKIVIGDARFVSLGLRTKGGFVGEHDRQTRMPLPDHISARHEDLAQLISGMVAFDRGPAQQLDAVIAAAALAFGFVYVHPFEDGNGRLHRYLIHHVLAARGFNPPGVVFPVSSAILDELESYKRVLEGYSKPLLPFIEWEATNDGNVRVLNETTDYYRYFDATPHAEFLYRCVQQTIEVDLPNETKFLRSFDRFASSVETIADMPRRTLDLLFHFLQQNNGILSKRAREKEFATLTAKEVKQVERLYAEAFEDQK